jgi:hypothetical protein
LFDSDVNSIPAGATFFILDLAFIGWVQFRQSPITATIVTVVAGIFLLLWLFWLRPSWATHASQPWTTTVFYKFDMVCVCMCLCVRPINTHSGPFYFGCSVRRRARGRRWGWRWRWRRRTGGFGW